MPQHSTLKINPTPYCKFKVFCHTLFILGVHLLPRRKLITVSKAFKTVFLVSLLCILQKGCGYHLDLLIVAIMLGVCSIMGLPWFVAATVLSISHVNSLKVESGCSAPGEQPKFLGIREQRVTGFMIFVLMGCSVFMTSALKVRGKKNMFNSCHAGFLVCIVMNLIHYRFSAEVSLL